MTTPPSGDDSSRDIDRRFSEIVAGYGPTPTAAEHTDTGEPAGPPQGSSPWRGAPSPDDPSPSGPSSDAAQASEDDEHFVPEAPDPLPAGDLHFWAIVVGLTLGPMLVFLSAALAVIDGMPFGVLGVALTVAGFVLLVLRSPRRRSGDEGSGARV